MNAIVSTYATSSGRHHDRTRRHRNTAIIADSAACSDGMAATRFTLACPESSKARAECKCSVPQPRLEIRSTNGWAPWWLVRMGPSNPPSGTPAGLRNMHRGLDGPSAIWSAVQRAAAHGGADGTST